MDMSHAAAPHIAALAAMGMLVETGIRAGGACLLASVGWVHLLVSVGGVHLLAAVAATSTSSGDTATGVGIPVALAAGLVSFLSPCVLPLVPGYLSTVIGVAPADLKRAGARRVLGPSLLFIASFSLIFILLGLTATQVGSLLNAHLSTLRLVGGALIVAMGVLFLATPFVDAFNFQWHSASLQRLAGRSVVGRGGPLVAGAAFAIAWTPCTSITLGAILTQAAVSSSAAHGALLLAFYSAGLAIPFLAIALAFERASGALAVVKRHFPVIIGVGGVVMIALGLLIVTGEFTTLNSQANNLLQGTGLDVSGI
jgi:cytochrome c-type biogenesis protein